MLSTSLLWARKNPNDINDEFSAIECRYKIDLTGSKKKAQVFLIEVEFSI